MMKSRRLWLRKRFGELYITFTPDEKQVHRRDIVLPEEDIHITLFIFSDSLHLILAFDENAY